MHVSRSKNPLTNYSWQVWRSIYNNHTDVKISPTMIWVHREQATLVNTQGISIKVQGKICLWQNTIMSIKLFLDFLLFMCVLDFWHKNKKRLIKNNNVKTFKYKNKQTIDFQLKLTKSKQPSIVTQHRKY